MNIALAQLNYHIGNFAANTEKMLQAIEQAKLQGAEIVVFAELSVCGYPPRDFLEFSDFIRLCNESVETLANACQGIAAVVGAPSINPVTAGKDLYNSAYFLADGKVQQIVHKSLLPTYDVFDEYRYFEPGSERSIVQYKGRKLAITICEDLWNLENELYTQNPMEELAAQGADLMINIAASPFDFHHYEDRLTVLRQNVQRYNIPVVYVNHVGAQTELIFDGGSMALDATGAQVAALPQFEEAVQFVDIAQQQLEIPTPKPDVIARIHDALVLGVRDYFRKLGFKQALVGLSGGIDSAVTQAIAAEALGAENVRAVLMPSRFSSDHSVNDAEELAQNLGSPYDTIPIERIFNSFEHELAPLFKGREFDVTEENLQARSRGTLLMALSNKFGYILLNTSNKSEAAVGYGTLYGDMCGGLAVIGDVYKSQVFELARYINRNGEIIPENIITKPPSAELRPDQKDSDSLPDYDVLDKLLHGYIEQRLGPRQLIALGFNEALVHRVLRLVNINEYKRFQTPPILRVSPKAFGMGRRMPIVGKYLA